MGFNDHGVLVLEIQATIHLQYVECPANRVEKVIPLEEWKSWLEDNNLSDWNDITPLNLAA